MRQHLSIERDGIRVKKFKAARIHSLCGVFATIDRWNGNNEYRKRQNEKWELTKQRMGCVVSDRAKLGFVRIFHFPITRSRSPFWLPVARCPLPVARCLFPVPRFSKIFT